MKIHQLEEIEKVTSTPEFENALIDAIADGFVAFSAGKFNAPPIQTMGAPPMGKFSCADVGDNVDSSKEYAAQVCIKSGYITGADAFVVKVASGGYPLPSNSGCIQVFSQKTGKMEALLMDEGILTELRTAAAGAVAALCLAPVDDIKQIGMLGTGIQARYQLRFLKHVTDCRDVLVYGRTPENVTKYVEDCEKEGWTVTVVEQPNDLLDNCELIVTTTSSREPVLGVDWKYTYDSLTPKYGTDPEGRPRGEIPLQHITCIGSDAPGKAELSLDLLVAAERAGGWLVADSKAQTAERGEFQRTDPRILGHRSVEPTSTGWRVAELGKVLQENAHIMSRSRGEMNISKQEKMPISIFDSSGVAVQDCVIADMVCSALASSKEGGKEGVVGGGGGG
uniref:Ornithine cyclodeaminase n=1 Tax=Minutocellus polymorphus TaxID=265543 RepID=A0A7S0ADU8_9STRA|mmetsp:Transcript_11672/g.19401  ORF Transcript_11672/g.19401 Transcript_11672/m.19401 type:complete len:394 (+) Transcript_11672:88-1269(+)|eukprot:CAMPEP_0197717842 /NCGR_PEP_ID=MMETSP1434-20131217/2230_1 /TAXON_ID=265543 /ORGANISM="Minutocellus polymorphus, Strain CCMP3303" /LENGTH=393 /DNA_ID=CAMNT_0043302421 /DNA_START=108 /DNA_END=1289 /DNA_ORIENTATION=-